MSRSFIPHSLAMVQAFVWVQIDGERQQVLCDFADLKQHKIRISTKRIDWYFIGNHNTYMTGVNPILVFMAQYQVMITFRLYICQIMSLAGADVIFSDI